VRSWSVAVDQLRVQGEWIEAAEFKSVVVAHFATKIADTCFLVLS